MTLLRDIIGFFRGDQRSAIVRRNIAGSFAVKVISLAASLMLVPITIGYVSSELYGIWLTIATIVSWANLFDLGFGHGLRNKVAESVAVGDWEKARSYVSTGYFFFFLVFVPVAAMVYLTCPMVDWVHVLHVDSAHQDLLVRVMRIVIIFFGLSAIVNMQGAVLNALQRTALNSLFVAIGQVAVLIVVYVLTLTTRSSLIYLAYAVCATPLVLNIMVSIWLYGFRYRRLCPSPRRIRRRMISDVLNLGIGFFIIQVAVIVLYQTINVILSNVAGPNAVTEYNVIYKYISIPLMVSATLAGPLWSAFTDAYTLRDFGWMGRAYKNMLKAYWLLIGVLLLLLVASPLAFDIWLHGKVEIHVTMVLIVTLQVAIVMWNNMHTVLINGTGRIRLQLYCYVIGLVANIPLALWLGRLWGAEGVLISVVALNLPLVFFMSLQIRKIINQTATGIWTR
ncbi:MAG: oligosaccharide flippase family protein [Alloprevotella sp.]|nr:oligosaccharide flippase family protein [Alloprevotella sp.]